MERVVEDKGLKTAREGAIDTGWIGDRYSLKSLWKKKKYTLFWHISFSGGGDFLKLRLSPYPDRVDKGQRIVPLDLKKFYSVNRKPPA